MKKTLFSIATVTAITGVASGNISASAYGDADDNNTSNTAAQENTTYSYSYSYSYDENGYTYSSDNNGYGENQTQQTHEAPEAPAVEENNTDDQTASAAEVNNTQQVQNEPQAPAAPQVQESAANNSGAAATAHSLAQGKSYQLGANSASLVDCSSFTQQFMQQHEGKDIPRTVSGQKAAGTPTANPQPGDLVFFNDGTHVGVYIGNGQMVDALNPSEGVGERSVSYVHGSVDGYYTY
ncbi:C40 family peptidase [Salinicoccus albus]|uniref:C40 family peptidase n=1 Tax=Salinicoccus albus TaxID=418756 RepID=UPI00036FD07D|nr:C40 family peptidase [Salinicoccus albus]